MTPFLSVPLLAAVLGGLGAARHSVLESWSSAGGVEQCFPGLGRPLMRRRLWRTALLIALVISFFIIATSGTSAEIKECRVGFAGVYKVGHWTPVSIDLVDVNPATSRAIEITASDSDGVPATYWDAVPDSVSADMSVTAALAIQVGRIGSTIRVVLRNKGEEIDQQEILLGPAAQKQWALTDLPATGELIVGLGSAPFGLEQAFPPRDATGGGIARRTVRLNSIADLPTKWFGYDAVDVLVLSVGDGALCRALASDAVRIRALQKWVELGGRMVILCGAPAATELLAGGQPLASLLPGKLAGVTALPQTGPLEHFSESSAQIGEMATRVELQVPQFVDVSGVIEAYAGLQPRDLPLVLRGPMGLGEVAVAGVDLSAPPLAEWPGRTAFLRVLLRPYVARADITDAPQSLMTLGYNDLSGALRQRLGSTFTNVRTISFPTVAMLAIAYLLILGPGDYWLVHKVLRRPAMAWITFPLLVVGACVGAYALAGWNRGPASPRINQIQLVDFDLVGGHARGTYWSTLYSPESRRFNLSLSQWQVVPANETLLACWGLTGAGIGGMDSRNVELGLAPDGYRVSPGLDALADVPLLTASTKSLLGRWTASAQPLVEAQLIDENDIPVGTIVNHSGGPLRNVRLLYGTWAYRLSNLADGEQVDIGPQLDAIQVKTMVTRSAGIAADQLGGESARSLFFSDRASAEELLQLMMFYEAAGGRAFAQLPSRYQSYCDLSRLLPLGRAIIQAEMPGPGRQLADGSGGKALDASGETRPAIVRFVVAVDKKE